MYALFSVLPLVENKDEYELLCHYFHQHCSLKQRQRSSNENNNTKIANSARTHARTHAHISADVHAVLAADEKKDVSNLLSVIIWYARNKGVEDCRWQIGNAGRSAHLEFLLDSNRQAITVAKQVDETAQHRLCRERQTLAANPTSNMSIIKTTRDSAIAEIPARRSVTVEVLSYCCTNNANRSRVSLKRIFSNCHILFGYLYSFVHASL